MSIHLRCTACNQPMRGTDTATERRFKCPQCAAVVAVNPAVIDIPAAETTAPETSTPQKSKISGLDDVWHLRMADGQQIGPLSHTMVDYWLTHGRIDANCQVFSSANNQWISAPKVFPQLSAPPANDRDEFLSQASTRMGTSMSSVLLFAFASSAIAGFYLFSAAILTLLNSYMISKGQQADLQLLGTGVVCLVVGCLVALIARSTFVYANKIAEFIETRRMEGFHGTLNALHNYWRCASIAATLFAIVLALVSILVVLGFVLPFINAIRHGAI